MGGLTTRPALVVVTGGILLTVLAEGSCLGGDGGDGGGGGGEAFWWTCLTLGALDLALEGFDSGIGKEGLGMNESFENCMSTRLRLMTLPFSSCMSYVLSLRCNTIPLHQRFGLWSVI